MHIAEIRAAFQYMLYLVTVEESPVSVNFNLPSGMVFMVDFWEDSSNDDEVGTSGFLIVGVVILYPSCASIHFLPRSVMCMDTFNTHIYSLLHLGNVEMVMYHDNQHIPYVMIRRATGIPLLLCGRIRIESLSRFAHPLHFWGVSIIG